jgi:hypothetical protein
MNSNLRLGVLLTVLISISAFSYFIFFRDTVSEQVAIENEIQTSTTNSSTSTTLKPENTTSTSTTTTTTTTTTIPPNQTVIYANAEEINNSKNISYDYLKGGCKEDLIGEIEKEWVLPYELFIFNEEKINFSLKLDSSLGLNVECLGKLIPSILNDSRGWIKVTDKEFQLVDNSESEFEFIFASPEKTDELCFPLETNGIYSCRNEDQIVINYFRWINGAIDFGSDMETYRLYLINHEVGHILGWGHVGCPKKDALAPVMMQQSKSTMGCVPYGWPIYEIIEKEFGIDTYSLLPKSEEDS